MIQRNSFGLVMIIHHVSYIILHPHCPFDYCVNDAKTFPLNNTDVQCAYNRSGLLCGHCKEGYSLVLGTVITGTLSGLGLYANIVGVNRTTFLPVGSTDALSVFIAWLNLDFGIETCFYNGMDSYTKTWLQFVFPAYIWVLVGLMIFISHFSQKFANLLCSNPVSLLATLILLSYTKVLRTLIATVYIQHTTEKCGCIMEILTINGKHIPLFLIAVLVFLFLFLTLSCFSLVSGCRPYHT